MTASHHLHTTSQALSRAVGKLLCDRWAVDQLGLSRYREGQVVIRAGQMVHSLPLLVAGRIDVVVHAGDSNQSNVVPIWFGAGEIAMLSYLFSQQVSSVDMVATEATEVRWIRLHDLEEQVANDAELAVLLVRFLSMRLREVQGRERTWVERGVPARVATTLARLAHDVMPVAGVYVLHATHDHIAQCAGVSRPKVSLALKSLERLGYVQLGRGVIRVLQLQPLKTLS